MCWMCVSSVAESLKVPESLDAECTCLTGVCTWVRTLDEGAAWNDRVLNLLGV